MAKIPVLEEDPDTGWSEWQTIDNNGVDRNNMTTIFCCDCNLAHDFEFRTKGKKVEWRVSRNKRSTAAARRKRK